MATKEESKPPYPKQRAKPSLTLKQKRFVEAYVGEAKGVGTDAARIAGYKDGVSLQQAVSRMLANDKIKAAIENKRKYLRRKKAEEGLTPEKITTGIADIAFDDSRRDTDRLKAFDLLTKILGMQSKTVKHEGEVQQTVILRVPDNGRRRIAKVVQEDEPEALPEPKVENFIEGRFRE